MNELQKIPDAAITPQHADPQALQARGAELDELFRRSSHAFDQVVTKSYYNQLAQLQPLPVVVAARPDMRWLRLKEIIYEKDERFADKLAMLYSSVHTSCRAVMIVLRKGEAAAGAFELFIGTADPIGNDNVSADILEKGLAGFFPGTKLESSMVNLGALAASEVAVTSVSGVASLVENADNDRFVQGIEQLMHATTNIKKFTVCLIAEKVGNEQALAMQASLEQLGSALSPLQQIQLSYSEAEVTGVNKAVTKSFNDSVSRSLGTSVNAGVNLGVQRTKAKGHGSADTVNAGFSAGGVSVGGATTDYTNETDSRGISAGLNFQQGVQETLQAQRSQGQAEAQGEHHDRQTGSQRQITYVNRTAQRYSQLIDGEIERLQGAMPFGLWSMGAYFIAADRSTACTLAGIYKGSIIGEKSNAQSFAINTWDAGDSKPVLAAIARGENPQFGYQGVQVSAGAIVSSRELAIHMSLPQSSVAGVHVHQETPFALEVITDADPSRPAIELGKVMHLGSEQSTPVMLDLQALTSHVFITGSTGSGKSETMYKLMSELRKGDVKMLVIEPAKGEYGKVFDFDHVYGTSRKLGPVLKINPFRFPEGIEAHLHIERLIEVFNVCWPMYAAMPAMLKEAIIDAYEEAGWDLETSENQYSNDLFPTFTDLERSLEKVIEHSKYSQEVKDNYAGSLITRVHSLTNGINGLIFSGEEIGDEVLFEENVIIDLSHAGSADVISLIMGILILRLDEFRSTQGLAPNSPLRHVTILEEAHNILKNSAAMAAGPEGVGIAAKSVEMLTRAIAQMRTYGEGFFIVDQAPGAVDIAAIRNTNTKIIMRLPEADDRRAAGKAAAMTDDQIEQLAKLPTGVAAVYQSNWQAPVLCHVKRYKKPDGAEVAKPISAAGENHDDLLAAAIKFLCRNMVPEPEEVDLDMLRERIPATGLPTSVKIVVLEAIEQYRSMGYASIWREHNFVRLAQSVTQLLGLGPKVARTVRNERSVADVYTALLFLLRSRLPGLPLLLEISVCQCLMRDYSLAGSVQENMYVLWLEYAKTKLPKS